MMPTRGFLRAEKEAVRRAASFSRKPSRRSMPVRLVWSCTTTATSPASPIAPAIGGEPRGGQIIGGAGGQRNIAVDAGVERDDRDLRALRLLQQRDRTLGAERGGEHVDLLVDRSPDLPE